MLHICGFDLDSRQDIWPISKAPTRAPATHIALHIFIDLDLIPVMGSVFMAIDSSRSIHLALPEASITYVGSNLSQASYR